VSLTYTPTIHYDLASRTTATPGVDTPSDVNVVEATN